MTAEIDNFMIDWGGRQALMVEAEVLVNRALQHESVHYAARSSTLLLPLVRPGFIMLPNPAQRPAVSGGRFPESAVVVELVSRSVEMRSRRWSTTQQRVMPLPRNWWQLARAAYPQMTTVPEYCWGWADIVVAAVRWINEHESEWRLSDAKEKFGALSLSTQGITEKISDDIIDAAEHLARHVCLVCGAPGGSGTDQMILCEPHRTNKSWWETGHE